MAKKSVSSCGSVASPRKTDESLLMVVEMVKSMENPKGGAVSRDSLAAFSAFCDLLSRLSGGARDKEKLARIIGRILFSCHGLRFATESAMLLALPYAEYLETDHWKGVRQQVLRDSGNRCSLCNADGELHCHHRTYANVGQERRGDVICLCRECHEIFHQSRRAEMQEFSPASEEKLEVLQAAIVMHLKNIVSGKE